MPKREVQSEQSDETDANNQFEQWCQMTGWHGVLDFYMANHLVWKVIWLTVVLAGSFFAINQSVSMIMDFASDDHWVTSTSYEMPKEGGFEWPNITVCPVGWPPMLNMWNDFMQYMDQANYTYDQFNITEEEIPIPTAAMNTTTADPLDQTTTETEMGDSDTSTEPTTGYQCPQYLAFCGSQFSEMKKLPMANCCHLSNDYDWGRCFRLKPNPLFGSHNMNQDGRVFYILRVPAGMETATYYSGYEIQLYLGESDATDDFSSSFLIQPGTRNVISMIMEERRTILKSRAIRFSKIDLPCNKPYTYLKTKTYGRNLCALDCVISWQVKYCGCFDNYYIPDSISPEIRQSAKNCTDYELAQNCSIDFESSLKAAIGEPAPGYFSSGTSDPKVRDAKCVLECPEPCTYRRVESKLSTSSFLPTGSLNATSRAINQYLMQSGLTEQEFSEEGLRQLTAIELYYESKTQRVVEKNPKSTIDELISNIGGCLGVWSGISFLSIFQIGYYVWRAVCAHLERRKVKAQPGQISRDAIYGGPKPDFRTNRWS